MLKNYFSRKEILLLYIIVILFGLLLVRWDTQTASHGNNKISKKDRWLNQIWLIEHRSTGITEVPVIQVSDDNREVHKILEDLRQRETAIHDLTAEQRAELKDYIATKERIESNIWKKRNEIFYAWSMLTGAAMAWLIVTLYKKNRNTV